MNKKIINVICIIICTVVGAGFASGKEIYRFFAELGKSGFIGIILSTFFSGIIIFFSLKIITKNKIKNNEELIKIIKAPRIFYYMINVFLLVSFYVMIAGFCSCFKQELNIPKYIPAVILCILLFAIFTKKSEWLAKINTVIAPILIIIIIYIFTKYGWNKESYIVENNSYILQTMVNAILYASYNSIVLIPILILAGKFVKTNKQIIVISVISSLAIGILAMLICVMLQNSTINLKNVDIPIVAIIKHKFEKYLYCIGIESAIFTSAVSAGYGFLENVSEKNLKKTSAIMCLLDIPIAYIGFGNLVNALYPVLGTIGIVQIILILKNAKDY